MADRGVTVGELSDRTGITRQMVGKYLHDGAVPNLDIACRMAGALGVSVDDLAVTPLNDVIS